MREPKEIPLLTILLSVEETADLLGLGRTHTYELVMSGKISSVKIGRRRLVVRDGLQEFVGELQRTQNTAEL
jgi:excisionase family DNA binding protein